MRLFPKKDDPLAGPLAAALVVTAFWIGAQVFGAFSLDGLIPPEHLPYAKLKWPW